MKLTEIKIRGNGKWLFLKQPNGDYIDLYLFASGEIYKNEKYTTEQLESEEWEEQLTEYKGIQVVYSKLCDLTNGGFSPFNMIVCPHNSSLELFRHEYGHLQQKKIYGKKEYFFKVALQSFIGFWLSKLKIKPLTHEEYHQQWWEAEADMYGGNEWWDGARWRQPIA